MIKIFLLAVLVILASAKYSRASHDYWYTAAKKTATTPVPYADVAWNYCDLKCLYLETYNPGKDFVVINFTDAIFKPDFAACYVKTVHGYALWNTISDNKFFEENCGGDSEDYIANSDYKIVSKEGEGKGTRISY